MNSFLQHLVARSLSPGPEQVRPRLPGPFDQLPDVGPRLVEPLPAGKEMEEKARPRQVILMPEGGQEKAAPYAITPRTSLVAEERPSLSPTASRAEQDRLKPPAIKRRWEDQQEAPPPVMPQRERGHRLTEPAQVDRRLVQETAPLTDLARGREPERQPAPLPSLRASASAQQVEPRPQPLDAPGGPEWPRAVTIEPDARPQGEEPAAEWPSLEIIPAASPPLAPPPPRPGRASAELPPIPPIQVTIGRIDVRAVFALPPPQPAAPRPAPAMSLEDYLKQRDGGRA